MAQGNVSRYKCIARVDKKTVTGKTDYKDRYYYRIFDKQSGKTVMFEGYDIKREMNKGTKIDGLELSVDGRLLFKDLKSAKTVITPSSTKVGKIGKKTSQCLDLSLVAEYLYSIRGSIEHLKGASTLRITNCGYGTMEQTSVKARMMGGYIFDIDNQKFIVVKNKDIVTLMAEKWVYSNRASNLKWSNSDSSRIGYLANILRVENIEINNIQFINESLDCAFQAPYGCGIVKSIRIINSDMSYIKSMNNLCYGQQVEKFEIVGTNLNNVMSMRYAFGALKASTKAEPLVLSIPETPKLKDAKGMFMGYGRNTLPNLEFMQSAKIKSADYMFSGSRLEYIDLSALDFTECENMDSMFSDCTDLINIRFGSKPITNLTIASNMFRGCIKATDIDILCINSQGLKMSNEDYLPRSDFYESGRRTRTHNMFQDIKPDARIRMNKELLDIIKSNRA